MRIIAVSEIAFSYINCCYHVATEHQCRSTYKCTIMATYYKNVCLYIFETFSLSFHHTALPHIICSLPVNVLKLYAKKNTATDCTLLYSIVHAL